MLKSNLTGIIPFTYYNKNAAGSTFLRAQGLANTNSNFEIWKHGHKYDNLIFQKRYWIEMMRNFQGPKILDLCDPDWLDGSIDIVEIANLVDAITCSSDSLTELLRGYFPGKSVSFIPDRLDFSIFPSPRDEQVGKAKKIIWFGYLANAYETLPQFAKIIKENELELSIITNGRYEENDDIKPLIHKNIIYDQKTVYANLKKADVIINPKSTKAFYKYKSNNKSVIGWKLGIPVAESCSELQRFLYPLERELEVASKSKIVAKEYNILKSAEQYQAIFNTIRNQKLVSL